MYLRISEETRFVQSIKYKRKKVFGEQKCLFFYGNSFEKKKQEEVYLRSFDGSKMRFFFTKRLENRFLEDFGFTENHAFLMWKKKFTFVVKMKSLTKFQSHFREKTQDLEQLLTKIIQKTEKK